MTEPEISVPLQITRTGTNALTRQREPVTAGIPFARGVLTDATAVGLYADQNRSLPTQTRVLERWPDSSIRWLLIDTQLTLPASQPGASLFLRQRRDENVPRALRVDEGSHFIHVNTGAIGVRLTPDASMLLSELVVDGEKVAVDLSLRIVDGEGVLWTTSWNDMTVAESGGVRTQILANGRAAGSRGHLELMLRLDFFADLGTVRVRLTTRNPRPAQHPGGIWELGDAGSLLLKEVSLSVRGSDGDTRVSASIGSGEWQECASFALTQESSGGENWKSSNHVNRNGDIPLRRRGYEGTVDDREITGLRATPIVSMSSPRSTLAAAIPWFWQNFPRAVSAKAGTLSVGFFPTNAADLYELQGGEQKTHECFLSFCADTVTDKPLEWCRSPLVLHATPEYYVAADAVHGLVTAVDEDPVFRRLVDQAIEGHDTFATKRERADEFGWRHFGDIYGDHEAVFHKGALPLMSHYNNQYDPVGGFLYQFMRTGDVRWLEESRSLAAHVVDIDIYHTTEDKAAYNQGLFWHTYHYVDAGKANHRSYPRGTNGGGPSSEQNYPSGLLLRYLMTGDTTCRDAALGLSRFVIAMDDGTRTPFKWLDRGNTGVASASRTPDYHGPGRGSGNSLNALVDGHRITGERTFMDKAEQIIRRCTHPRQDLEPLNLLDAENRWFYTMYLQSLGKYLEWKAELGELDAMYAYGRDVLLHYARWMAVHERPYLERPELLEYPTETWAAQDIRKSEVFDHAARYAGGEERARFAERAEYFFRYSVETLNGMATRSLARPVVLLLGHGYRRSHARKNGVVAAPVADAHWETKWPTAEAFAPQKTRAKKRFVQLMALIGGAAILMVLLAVWLLVRA